MTRSQLRRVALLGILTLASGCRPSTKSEPRADALKPAANTWTQSGFAEFSKGTFGDAGVNTYVTASGKIQLVNRFDLNNDGWIDLVFANSHPQAEKLDQSIFWGDGKDFDVSRKTLVPNEGAQWTVAADLNGDGKTDIICPSYANGTWTKMQSSVYYGDPGLAKERGADSKEWNNYPFVKKVSLPTEAAQQAAVGDLNKDGYPDIVFALSSGFWEYRGGGALASPSRIFWGSKEGFDPKKFTDIEAAGASDVAIADLNNDGWPDIVFANSEKDGKTDTDSYVYFGGAEGFSPQRRANLPTRKANAVTLADLNGDKFIDIVFANSAGNASYIYMNQGGSFDAAKKIELPTSDARDVAAGDLNGDGVPDLFFSNFQTANNRLTTSYLYFNDGHGGFSADKRQEFETIGAWGVSIADLNKDGRNDIVVSNFQDQTSFEQPSYIFWNSPNGFDQSRRTSLFTQGAVGNCVADFDNDGNLDICFNNTSNRYRGGVGRSFVYYGNKKGKFTVDHRQDLPTVEAYDWAAGDLNDDGWPDLVFANMAEVGRRIQENYVYWGSPQGFSPAQRSALMGRGTRGVSVADLDKNGWLDVLVLNTNVTTDDKNLTAYIYWGEPTGFVTGQRTEIPSGGSGLPAIADLNGDGNLDLLFAAADGAWIYWGDGTRNFSTSRKFIVPGSKGTSSTEIADMNRDGNLDLLLLKRGTDPSYVYYGDGKGNFPEATRNAFTPKATQGATVADVNGDGWLDVICGRYTDGGSRATMSPIFFGSPNGLSDKNMIELPTNAGTGSQVSDYNHDGYPDLLFYCHRSEGDVNKAGKYGDHCTDSYLYWGGPKGFDVNRKDLIPAEGVHYDGGADLGNIRDRSLQFDYISTAHQHDSAKAGRIEWTAQTPHGSRIEMQIRTASDEQSLKSAHWSGPRGDGSVFKSSGSRFTIPVGHSWIQYRAILVSPNGGTTPALERVSVTFD